MQVVNAAVILFVLTISAWKCGQANAAPGFWESDTRDPAFDNNEFHNGYIGNQFRQTNDKVELSEKQNVKGNQAFAVQPILKEDKVALDRKQGVKDSDQGFVASEDGVFHEVRNQKAEYGHIKPTLMINVNSSQSAAELKPPTHKPTGFWNRVFGPAEMKNPFSAVTNQTINYKGDLISDGPIIIKSNQSS